MRLHLKTALVAALISAGAFALPADATTITFGALPDEGSAYLDPNGGTVYKEAGFTVTGTYGVLAYYNTPGAAHIDDAGTGFTSALDFALTSGGTFDAVSFDLISSGYDYIDPLSPPSDNIVVTGYDLNGIVASASFTLSAIVGALQTINLGTAFTGLTGLSIELLYQDPAGNFCAPCAHFDLDSVTFANVAAVPLPAPAALLAAGVGALVVVRRRRKVRTGV